MTRANITSWKTLPQPEQRDPLGFAAEFTDAETDLLVLGLIPKEMEDKWFICLHQGWLLFYRSWTGACIYGLRLEAVRGGSRVVDSWVSRDPAQYKGTDVDYDRKLVRFLIDAFLFHREAIFPMPAGVESVPPGAYQQSMVGRAYPESPPEPCTRSPRPIAGQIARPDAGATPESCSLMNRCATNFFTRARENYSGMRVM